MSDAETPETPQDAGQAPAEETVPAPQSGAESEAAPAAAEQAPAAADEQVVETEVVVDEAPREKPAVPGAHLEVDIVPEGVDPLASGEDADPYDPYAADETGEQAQAQAEDEPVSAAEPIAAVAIDLGAGAKYRATGKRKTAVARVMLRPGTGTYLVNGRTLEEFFPRETLQRNVRQPLEAVGYEERMDVVARLHGGGIAAQAGALRHGISRALLEADPNLRGELKRRGFLTRDSRAKERKKAGLKKARKRPQFSKR